MCVCVHVFAGSGQPRGLAWGPSQPLQASSKEGVTERVVPGRAGTVFVRTVFFFLGGMRCSCRPQSGAWPTGASAGGHTVPGAVCCTGLHPPRRAQAAEEGAEDASCHRCVLGSAVTIGLAGAGEGREHSCFGVGTLRGLAQA
ncbi:unnamed protein product [Rangifer tarandus platyrhynchus]|uniref:Uncharacterized protein n=2 Tax=Rangifer tarandus platyrhynchus TaxID=3082113 RepID=A0AC59YHH2_RANTA|nr:unnamed protein product [Rangifer tarandus platyrhynchus]